MSYPLPVEPDDLPPEDCACEEDEVVERDGKDWLVECLDCGARRWVFVEYDGPDTVAEAEGEV